MSRQLSQTAGALTLLLFLAFLPGCQTNPPRKSPVPDWFDVTLADDFEFDAPSSAWRFRTPSLWRIAYEGDRRFLQMAIPPEGTRPGAGIRPWEYAVYGRYEFRSFSLSCRVRIDRELTVEGRDVCILFGRQDPGHYYYLDLSADSGDFRNTLVRVDGPSRKALLSTTAARPPTITDRAWHRVDILRDVDSGTIKVYVDAEPNSAPPKPTLEGQDRSYPWGTIALGSFGHHASFARLAIEGQAREPRAPGVSLP
ncbi:MAG TPA: hypothetical protein PKY77_02135 [Phycisphaerae bacterium]|nr:hypothetical protein [Phycisphaerae bacterium]HRY67913.1 hypothetical protein [Phycisphaerae bacterium]HSA26072.1 hypothetical protein [Phycisphaerae bacterium]